jgi:hypothetical protein
MPHRQCKFLAAGITAICVLVAGCAVLTVDVDVYKGPLANTEQIQGEQAISLVMGAKPLLVQLRDQLEVSRHYWRIPYTGIPLRPPSIYSRDEVLECDMARLRAYSDAFRTAIRF